MNRVVVVLAALAAGATSVVLAQNPASDIELDNRPAMMRPMIERYLADRNTLERA